MNTSGVSVHGDDIVVIVFTRAVLNFQVLLFFRGSSLLLLLLLLLLYPQMLRKDVTDVYSYLERTNVIRGSVVILMRVMGSRESCGFQALFHIFVIGERGPPCHQTSATGCSSSTIILY
jgi:hypothetical protein